MCALLYFEQEKSVDITWPSIRDSVRRTEFRYTVAFEGSSLKWLFAALCNIVLDRPGYREC